LESTSVDNLRNRLVTTEARPLNRQRSLAQDARDFGCGLPLRSRPHSASS
jgi:hypothetical protein